MLETEIEKRIKCIDAKMKHLFIPDLFVGGVVIDAGASSGRFIEKFRAEGFDNHIIAIEPNNNNIKTLMSKNFVNVEIVHKAMLGLNCPSKVIFTEVVGLSEWGSTTDVNDTRGRAIAKQKLKYEVETITLDEIIKSSIDYLKIDIECSETEVVKTFTKEMAKSVRQISLEVHNGDELVLTEVLQGLGYIVLFQNGEIFAVRKELI